MNLILELDKEVKQQPEVYQEVINKKLLLLGKYTSLHTYYLLPQPTRGLDVGAIEYIRKRIIEERDKGRAILLISFELDEIMNLCDRIATISKGAIVGIFNQGEVTEKRNWNDDGRI